MSEETRERPRPAPAPPRAAASPPQSRGDALRRSADRFFAAGDAAIEQALSGNSQRFLDSSRQEGGE